MKFIDKEHKEFFEKYLKVLLEHEKIDVYYKSLIYTIRNL